jgi:hypothetical protein
MRRLVALALGVLCTACPVGGTGAIDDTGEPTTPPLELPTVEPGGAETLQRAIDELCEPIGTPGGTPASGELPVELAEVAERVEDARGHAFPSPPAAEAITEAEMDRRLDESFDAYYPKELYDRRTFAWRTIGVIPPDADLREAYRAFLTGGVVGFYDTQTGELVYIGGGELGLTERLTLAHELTHALDDQVHDLTRLDHLTNTCQDEAAAAALGLVEGSAQFFSAAAAAANAELDFSDLIDAIAGAAAASGGTAGVPPFVDRITAWPYLDGMRFVGSLVGAGGTDAVDEAFERLPASTEQVMHPERYPSDRPAVVEITDVTEALGRRWGDLDAMTVGEEWLRAMLGLRLDGDDADSAAAGWDGGAYRAFTDGDDVVVVLRTAWDSTKDAREFESNLGKWVEADPSPTTAVWRRGNEVTAVFSTSAAARDEVASALS